MHTATPNGDSVQELKLEVAVICMISPSSQRGVLKARRPPLASMLGVGYDSLHTHRPTIGGQHLPFAREGGEHAAQFGVARFAGGSSTFPTRKWEVPGAPADEGGRSRF